MVKSLQYQRRAMEVLEKRNQSRAGKGPGGEISR